MSQYEICYVDGTGTLLGTFFVSCAADKQARVMAHAMRLDGTRQIEVWDGARLVYERPATPRAAAIEALRSTTTLYAAE